MVSWPQLNPDHFFHFFLVVLMTSEELTLKVLVATIDALGHFETR